MTYRLMFAAAAAALLAAPAAMAQSTQEESPWSGFYAGANLGITWGNTHPTLSATSSGPTVNPLVSSDELGKLIASGNKTGSSSADFTGGGELGYNWRSGSLLLGIETDIDAFLVDQKRSSTFQTVQVNPLTTTTTPITATLTQHGSTEWLWTVRGRIGYIAGNWLLYGTGGIATSDVKTETLFSDTATPPNTASIHNSKTKTGWTAGVGAAYAFSPNWSTKLEWLYTDLGKVTASATSENGFTTFTSGIGMRAHIIRAGIDYRF